MNLERGTKVSDRYVLDQFIGRGGMGEVWSATDAKLRRPVAIKFLSVGPASPLRDQLEARFQAEAGLIAQLRNEHIVWVIDFVTSDVDGFFIVMELLSGSNLAELLKRRGPLPITEALDYVLQACVALAAAHSHGVIHRDLKPANLFLHKPESAGGVIKLLDFGIAKQSASADENSFTKTGQALGTPAYMSPEQHLDSKDVGVTSDIWSLGVVLYELVTGVSPFGVGSYSAIAVAVCDGKFKAIDRLLPTAPRQLVDVVTRCLSQRPQARFQSVAEVAQALEPIASLESRRHVREIVSIHDLAGTSVPATLASQGPSGELKRTASPSEMSCPPVSIQADTDLGWSSIEETVKGIAAKDVETVFLVGNGIHDGSLASGRELLDALRRAWRASDFPDDEFDSKVAAGKPDGYLAALRAFSDRKLKAISTIRQLVIAACTDETRRSLGDVLDISECFKLEREPSAWRIPIAIVSLARLLSHQPPLRGLAAYCLTTNFDPMIEVALRSVGATPRIHLAGEDGALDSPVDVQDRTPTVVRLHGDWLRDKALHTSVVTQKKRSELATTLRKLVAERHLVVLGYSGSDPQLIDVLVQLASSRTDSPSRVTWLFHQRRQDKIIEQNSTWLAALQRAYGPQRLSLCSNVDAAILLKDLAGAMTEVRETVEQAIKPGTDKAPVSDPGDGAERNRSLIAAAVLLALGVAAFSLLQTQPVPRFVATILCLLLALFLLANGLFGSKAWDRVEVPLKLIGLDQKIPGIPGVLTAIVVVSGIAGYKVPQWLGKPAPLVNPAPSISSTSGVSGEASRDGVARDERPGFVVATAASTDAASGTSTIALATAGNQRSERGSNSPAVVLHRDEIVQEPRGAVASVDHTTPSKATSEPQPITATVEIAGTAACASLTPDVEPAPTNVVSKGCKRQYTFASLAADASVSVRASLGDANHKPLCAGSVTITAASLSPRLVMTRVKGRGCTDDNGNTCVCADACVIQNVCSKGQPK